MPLDPSIISGLKPVQIDTAQFSPMNAMMGAMKLRQLDQEGELNALTLKERKGLQAFLPGKDLSDPEVRYQLAANFGETGRKIAAGVTAIGTAQTAEGQRRISAAVEKSKLYNNMLVNVTDQRSALQWLQDQKNDPDMAGSPIANMSIMEAASKIPADPDGFAQWKEKAALGLGEYIKQNKPMVVGSSSSVYNPLTKTFDQAPAAPATPAAPPSMVAEYNFAKTSDGGGFRGSFQDFVTARAAAGRAPAQPRPEVAPTITQIVDPTDPNKMITIDARRYTGGSIGSPGVIGVAGKEPGAALRQNKVEAGKTQLADDLANLRASFEALDKMRAIPSTERNVLSNIGSATAATGVGQVLGRFGGTQAQVERDVINSARTRLVNSIKNATGMSAQQLNSNVELQTMLKSISDPGQSIQAALRIIGDIEDAYVKGDGKMPTRGAAGAAPAAAGALSPIDQQALQWANSNPTDPRAAAIKQRLGK
jgi:hypothetical protein